MSNGILFIAQLKREWIMTKRYFFNSIGGIVAIFVIFILIFMGYKGFAGGSENYELGLGNLLVGYISWMFGLLVYQDISDNLKNEAREGILEQLYMSPFGYIKITAFRLIVSFLANIIMVAVAFLIMMLITGRYLNMDMLSIIPLLLGFLFPIAGLSFMLGGIQLLFKKIDAFMQLVQFILIAFVALPVDGAFFGARFLPGTMASNLLRDVMVSGTGILDISATSLITTAAVCVAYLAIGFYIFKICERKAMSDGRLAHY